MSDAACRFRPKRWEALNRYGLRVDVSVKTARITAGVLRWRTAAENTRMVIIHIAKECIFPGEAVQLLARGVLVAFCSARERFAAFFRRAKQKTTNDEITTSGQKATITGASLPADRLNTMDRRQLQLCRTSLISQEKP